MIIEYCEGCGLRISESELQDGQTVKLDGKSFHAKCAPAQSVKKGSGRIGAVATPAGTEIVTSQSESRGSKTGLRPARRDSKASIPRPPTSSMQSPAGSPGAAQDAANSNAPKNSHSKWMLIGGGAAALIGIGLIIAFSGSTPEPTPQNTNAAKPTTPSGKSAVNVAVTPTTPAVELIRDTPKNETVTLKFDKTEKANPGGTDKELESMRNERAAKLLQDAKTFAKDHPEDPKKYYDKLQTVLTTYRSTPAAEEAGKLITEVKLPEVVTLTVDEEAWKQAVNVLTMVDVSKDSVSGTWKIENGTLTVAKNKESRLHLPYQPGDEYDLRVTFSRQDGGEGLMHYLSYAGKPFVFVLSGDWNKTGGFALVKGQSSTTNPSTVKARLETNKKYTLVFQVRAEGVRAFLDNKMLTQWSDYKDLSLPAAWKMKNDTAIGLANQNCKVTYHAIDVLDVKGTGKPLRGDAATTPVTAVGNATPPQKTDPVKTVTDEAAAAATTAKVEYEKMLADVYALLSKEGTPQALAKLEKARSDKIMAPMKADVEMELQLAHIIDDLNKAALEGAKALTDKRPFTFKRSDGKEVITGKGTHISVIGVKDDAIEIEEAAGGGKIQAKIDIDQLSPASRYELSRLGLAPGPDSYLKLAYGGLVMLQNGSDVVTLKDVRNSLELARKGQASPEQVKHLTERLDFYELDQGGEAAYRKVEAIAKDKKFDAAKTALEEFRRDYLGTRSVAKLQTEIDKLASDIEFALMPLKPGLWAVYWTLDSKEKQKSKVLSRPETKITQDWGLGSPDKLVPVDNFAIRFEGLLRVDQEAKYKFTLAADDKVSMKLDGKAVKHNDELKLTKGDHEIVIYYVEIGANANLTVKWKLEGGADQDLPPTALWYDPKLIDKYEAKR